VHKHSASSSAIGYGFGRMGSNTVDRRRRRFVGHVSRLPQEAGNRRRDIPRMAWLDTWQDDLQVMGVSCLKVKKATENAGPWKWRTKSQGLENAELRHFSSSCVSIILYSKNSYQKVELCQSKCNVCNVIRKVLCMCFILTNTRRTRLIIRHVCHSFRTNETEIKRECPQRTRATPERGAMRQTSHTSRCGVAVAAAVVTVAVALADGVELTSSSSSLLSSEVNWNASVWGPRPSVTQSS